MTSQQRGRDIKLSLVASQIDSINFHEQVAATHEADQALFVLLSLQERNNQLDSIAYQGSSSCK